MDNYVVLINSFSYRFLLVDFGLAQCVSADFPVTDTPSETILQTHKRKREEVNTEGSPLMILVFIILMIKFFGL